MGMTAGRSMRSMWAAMLAVWWLAAVHAPAQAQLAPPAASAPMRPVAVPVTSAVQYGAASVCTSMPAPLMPAAALRESRNGWVVAQLRMKGNAMLDARIVAESGGAGFGDAVIAAMHSYQCNFPGDREVNAEQRFEFHTDGLPPAPEEGFGWHAFEVEARSLATGIDDLPPTVCPIRARVLFKRQLGQSNEILDPGNVRDARLLQWLAGITPRVTYMVPSPKGSWVRFTCQVVQGRLII